LTFFRGVGTFPGFVTGLTTVSAEVIVSTTLFFHFGQRWAPSAYNLRPLGVSLGISGHRTDLVQEISEPDRDRAQAERELTYAGSRMGTGDWQTVRVGLGVSNTRPIPSGYRAGIGFGM
jgi:hypothetical protein